jgi:GntR family transcriptional regulator
VRRRRGRNGGTFILDRAQAAGPRLAGSFDNLFSTKQVRRIEVLAFEPRTADAAVCEALHLPPSAPVIYVERRLVTRDGPIAHVRSFLPPVIGGAIRRRDVGRRLLQDLVLEHAGAKAVEMRDEVEGCLADSAQARMLDVGAGRPLLRLRRTILAPGDEPISYTTIHIASERYTVVLRQRSP